MKLYSTLVHGSEKLECKKVRSGPLKSFDQFAYLNIASFFVKNK